MIKKILLIIFIIIILLSIIFTFFYIFKNFNNDEKINLSFNSSNLLISSIFDSIYKKYLNQYWPIISTLDHSPPLLNIAFPDSSVTYYASFFNSKDNVLIYGTIPPNIYFWSLCMYDIEGNPIQSWNYSQFPTNKYLLELGPNFIIPPDGNYCIINRIYNQQNPFDEIYLPSIQIYHKNVKPVSDKDRITNSNYVQNLIWKLFNFKYGNKSPYQLVPDVSNYHTFFLPSQLLLSSVFPNPSAKYLIVFPSTNNVIKVKGTLYPSIGYNNTVLFISYMASDLSKTSTDISINFTQLAHEYTLYVAFSKIEAIKFGYNEKNDQLLLWSNDNQYPVLIYREVSISNNTPLFTLNNQTISIEGKDVENVMGIYYPKTICF